MCRKFSLAASLVVIFGLFISNAAFAAIVEVRIANGNDDIEEHLPAGNMDITSSDVEMPYENAGKGNLQMTGLRFVGIDVPQGAAIKNAYLEFTCDETKDGTLAVSLLIEGDLSPNAAALTTTTGNLSARTTTAAKAIWEPADWTAAGQTDQSSNIGPVIEEIVGQSGWSRGNALVLILRDNPDNPSEGTRGAESYDGDATAAALLHIEWGPQSKATSPVPADGQTDVSRDGILSWNAGVFAAAHDIYFGTSLDDVTNATRANALGVLVSQGQSAATYDPGRLEFGQTYYWRVDEVNAPPSNAVIQGDVWSFTVEPFVYAVQNIIATASSFDGVSGPENTINGSGLNADDQHSIEVVDMWQTDPADPGPIWIQYEFDGIYKLHEMWVWNYNVQFEAILGFGFKDVTVEYSTDGVDWQSLGDVEFAKAASNATYTANTVVDFGGAAAKYVRLTANSNWGGLPQMGLSEVRFLYIPAHPREPQPADGATGVDPQAPLTWRAGREAGSHEVYLGSDPAELTLVETVGQATYAPGNLEFGSTYYWQIVEVNAVEAISAWEGAVWNFSTETYALIDGFETYNDDIEAGTAIFDTWLDGWVNDNGATVGYFDAPFAEKTIVHSGGQSMPLAYDNTASPFYSETERVFDSAQNWSVNGADALVLYFQGVPGPFVELASGKIIMGAAGADIWNAADEFRFVYKPLNGNGSIVAYVESVANTDPWAKGGVMIRETLDAGSTFAAVYSTPGNGCRYQARLTSDVAAVSDSGVATPEQIALLAPHWVKIERIGNSFNGYYSTDGENWTSMSWNPQTIAMTSNVYIGLALTSHSAGVLASAEFSDIATTGNVTGQWAVETIGPAQPEGNGNGSLYVTLEDATGKTATAVHPAGDAAVLLGGWNEWAIPYSDLSGVNLGRVEKMIIGVGNRANPSAGGDGLVYIDDVGFGKPAQ